MGYDYTITYKKDQDNLVVDALSRVPKADDKFDAELLTLSSISSDFIEQIKGSYETDSHLQQLLQQLQQDPLAKPIYMLKDSVLYRKGKIVVGPCKDLRKQILQFLYDGATGGHLGMIATLQRTTVSDRDVVFLSKFWQSLFYVQGVQLHHSTIYHPQSDGQTEVVNKCLEGYLRCMCIDRPKDWAHWLPLAEWWYNITYHSATKLTPFEVLYGQKPPLHMPYIPYNSMVEEVDRSLQAREATIRLLKHHLALAQS
uniref:Uncharacterized protein LOC104238238 n=1 Tax=Nicotiana sylvestris TaxID=4096 RepID=A0A1U7XWH3_NICSY|nr:PREDICTED: uncharacterized protein LOC104238238 [Nicotiana sylvestris]